MAGTTTATERRPRPDMDVELSSGASNHKRPSNNNNNNKSRALPPVQQSRDLPADAQEEEEETPINSSSNSKPDSLPEFVTQTAGKVGVKPEQVESVTEKVLELIQQHAPPDVIKTISTKVPGADKYLGTPEAADENKPDDDDENKRKEEEEEGEEEDTNEDKPEEPKTRAGPSTTGDTTTDAAAAAEEEEDDAPPKSCLPSCLENLLNKATGGKGTDIAAITNLLSTAGVTPDKAAEIVKQLMAFLEDKAGKDTVQQITQKVPGLDKLIGGTS
ncbi:expressed unknown protein [Seminavis robusta]|uniref:Uncharacterized protein n=1 Tax=Seminavis robusta TaxID=568900 RepID=A0A9N8HY87_9STRA|nr:expressed unknown protein [Seminavis robusta]|eukprot:Sro2747_g336170.1 n/a (274) ;mRNA; r:10909-11730